ncbi:cation:proton antiporter [Tardisphaera miroshnichenkoae]
MAYYGALFGVLELALLLMIGKVGEEAFSKARVMPFVGAIVLGIIMGPGVTGIMTSSPYTEEFISLGIVFILFMAGVEDKPSRVLGFRKAIAAGVAVFSLSLVMLVAVFRLLFRFGLTESLVMAVVLGMVSAGPFSRTIQESRGNRQQADESSHLFIEVMTMEISAVLLFAFASSPSSISSPSSAALYALKIAAVIGGIMAFGLFASKPLIERLEGYLRTREASFSVVVGMVLLFGFLAQYVGFNSAIAAFFLGAFMSDEIRANAYMLEKLRALTYGFFEPMFFMGLGLYFTRIAPSVLTMGIAVLASALAVKLASSYAVSRKAGVDPIRNFFAISHEGGVDGAILLTALSLSLINSASYSAVMIAITALAIIGPLGYQRGLTLESPRQTPSISFIKYELRNVTAGQLANTLSTVSMPGSSALGDAAYALEQLRTRVLIVVDDEGRPLGYVNDHELLKALEEGKGGRISDLKLHDVPRVGEGASGQQVLDVFEREIAPVVAVVDDEGRLVGSVLEREVLRFLLGRQPRGLLASLGGVGFPADNWERGEERRGRTRAKVAKRRIGQRGKSPEIAVGSKGGGVAVFLLMGSSFFLVASLLATAFPPLVFASPLWLPFQVIPSTYLVLVASLWSLTFLSFYVTGRARSGDRDALAPLVPAASSLICLPIALSVVGMAGLFGTAFCALVLSALRYRAEGGGTPVRTFSCRPACSHGAARPPACSATGASSRHGVRLLRDLTLSFYVDAPYDYEAHGQRAWPLLGRQGGDGGG